MSAVMYFTNPEVGDGFRQIGFPPFFKTILGTAKLIGAIVLVAPVWNRLKEWAYAGFLCTFIGATWVHLETHTPFMGPVVALAILAVSYVFWTRVQSIPNVQ